MKQEEKRMMEALNPTPEGETREQTLAREKAFFESLPKVSDPLMLRILTAWPSHEPAPPRPLSEMTLMERAEWECDHPEIQEHRLTQSAAMSVLMNCMRQGQLTDAQFNELLEEGKTHAGRLAMLSRAYGMS